MTKIKALAAANKTTTAAIALAWFFNKPQISIVIAGARTIAHLKADAAAVNFMLDQRTADYL